MTARNQISRCFRKLPHNRALYLHQTCARFVSIIRRRPRGDRNSKLFEIRRRLPGSLLAMIYSPNSGRATRFAPRSDGRPSLWSALYAPIGKNVDTPDAAVVWVGASANLFPVPTAPGSPTSGDLGQTQARC